MKPRCWQPCEQPSWRLGEERGSGSCGSSCLVCSLVSVRVCLHARQLQVKESHTCSDTCTARRRSPCTLLSTHPHPVPRFLSTCWPSGSPAQPSAISLPPSQPASLCLLSATKSHICAGIIPFHPHARGDLAGWAISHIPSTASRSQQYSVTV